MFAFFKNNIEIYNTYKKIKQFHQIVLYDLLFKINCKLFDVSWICKRSAKKTLTLNTHQSLKNDLAYKKSKSYKIHLRWRVQYSRHCINYCIHIFLKILNICILSACYWVHWSCRFDRTAYHLCHVPVLLLSFHHRVSHLCLASAFIW